MADSYRLRPLKALTTLLQGITPANGYSHDLSQAVFRGRTVYSTESDPKTMLSILEAPRPDIGVYGGESGNVRSEKWALLLQGWTPDDPLNPSDPAYALMEDVEDRMRRVLAVDQLNGDPRFPEHYLLGKTVTSFTVGPGVVRPPDNVQSKAFFYLPVWLGLAVALG